MKNVFIIFLLSVNIISVNLYSQKPKMISGTVTYDNKISTPLSNVKLIIMNQKNQKLDSVLTDMTGYYQFTYVPDGTYSIEASSDIMPSGGVDPVDAMLIGMYINGRYHFPNDLRAKAADVVANKNINFQDALMIMKFFYGETDTLGWIFDTSLPVIVSGKDVVYNIKGICRGDVNASYKP